MGLQPRGDPIDPMPRLLDLDLLQRLEAAWRAQGALIADALAPGLTDAEIDHLTAAGLQLPAEARLWWGWHNGATGTTSQSDDIGHDVIIYSLGQALEEFRNDLGGGGELAPASWLPLAQVTGGLLCIDCTPAEIAPVHRVDWQTGFTPGTDSMGELVERWLEMYEAGAWTWNPSGWWDYHDDRAPEWVGRIAVI
jgi:hypothetical protein